VLLVIAPFIGAIVLTWWLGAYAIVFGVALLALASSCARTAWITSIRPTPNRREP